MGPGTNWGPGAERTAQRPCWAAHARVGEAGEQADTCSHVRQTPWQKSATQVQHEGGRTGQGRAGVTGHDVRGIKINSSPQV